MSKKREDSQSVKPSGVKQKRAYSKPKIQSERMIAFGAVCNGTGPGGAGGRKTVAGAPDFCLASKLLS